MKEITFKIKGMDCAGCAQNVEKAVAKLRGVKSAEISFAASTLKVVPETAEFDNQAVTRSVTALGYAVECEQPVKSVTVVVEGMDCADESTMIEKELRKLPGVKSVRFNLVAREAEMKYDASLLTSDRIIEAIDRTGMKGRLRDQEIRSESLWERLKPLFLTVVSGFFLLAAAAFSWAGYPHKVTDPLYILAIVTGGYFIARKGLMALRALSLDMNFLMTIAVIGAALIEEWLEGATIVLLFSVANILQNYTMDRARNAIRSLMKLAPNEVDIRRNGREEKVPVEEVRIGERIIVKPGGKIGLDGRVVDGHSYVNQAPITGESLPVEKNPGSTVYAGTINQEGSLEVEVTHAYRDTTLSRIIHMVEEAQAQKAPSQSIVENFAKYYTPAVIGIAVLIAIVPPLAFGYPFDVWFYRSLVLLVIACPCALVISTPVSIVSGLTAAARTGILIKGGVHMEQAGSLKVMAFDKTGTLTRGVPRVTDVISLNGYPAQEILRVAASLENRSQHHLGKAIIEEASRRGIDYPEVADFQSITGKGIRANVDGQLFYVGNHRLCEELGRCSIEIDARMLEFEREKKTAVILFGQEHALGIIAVADEIRPESASAMTNLKANGVERIVMLTGDNRGTAEAIAKSLAIDEYHAELLPGDKADIIRNLREKYGRVAMVGDGVNDAPSMAAADVGIAMGTIGTDTALETADVALMTDDLSKLPYLLRLSRMTLRTIKQNIAFSILIKAVFISLAIPGMATLWMAVGADMGASILVILNGLALLVVKES